MLPRNSNKQENDGRNISFIVKFELLTSSSGISKLSKRRTVEELASATDDDTLADSCPWFDKTKCNCNCASVPALGNVFLDSQTPIKKDNEISDSDEYDEDDVATFLKMNSVSTTETVKRKVTTPCIQNMSPCEVVLSTKTAKQL